ncbi:MAG: hypothetical protein HPY83_06795 [Anaerolineae bacterium]|nr:hypothetical protein [Anaerolineae bacterium]
MSDPIVFVAVHKVKPGKVDGLRAMSPELTEAFRAGKPQTLAYLTYLSADGNEVGYVQVYADADAMERHMEGLEDRLRRLAEFMDFHRYEIFGRPSDETLHRLRQAAGPGVTLTEMPEYISGYIRLLSI